MAYCERCERYFSSEPALEQHKDDSNAHHSLVHHYCQRCDDHFDSHNDLISHYEEDHDYCKTCNLLFKNAAGLHEHNRQSHWYCVDCRQVFRDKNGLNNHSRSAVHRDRIVPCPGRNCNKWFMSGADLVLHWESGTCPSHVDRDIINSAAAKLDRSNIITNPNRLIAGPDGYSPPSSTVTATWATERSWNGCKFECVLCHREFKALRSLNQHLRSPAHAEKIFKCPRGWNGCGNEFRTLSALLQHVESEQCGVHRFNSAMQRVIGSLGDGLNRLTL
ncbi:uncharacterized protein LAESUDRAFT_814855 [Laetiporus sulphureus 93-53]|uniref:C2H2-type domain-containing protein n=1 Tax=Laetiporus sulphureus 93-53 TaxID=1314785 RepID=A0A165CQ61_9APHY|nr:uncharacterized protein LAESUDRAFT_814855 [Laetiporus sulphureus 93-53]KZT03219.1 hypothetical protein LAESUDRAFT_814855 [Laetiporus sulphureus 93-53]